MNSWNVRGSTREPIAPCVSHMSRKAPRIGISTIDIVRHGSSGSQRKLPKARNPSITNGTTQSGVRTAISAAAATTARTAPSTKRLDLKVK